MYPRQHIILGFIFSAIIFFIFPSIKPIGFLIIFLSSVLIDVDHYLYYVYKKKDWSLSKAYEWFVRVGEKERKLSRKERNKHKNCFMFLHGIEILTLLYILGAFFHTYFFYVLIGFAFHLFLDTFYEKFFNDKLEKVSVIWDYIKFKKSENKF